MGFEAPQPLVAAAGTAAGRTQRTATAPRYAGLTRLRLAFITWVVVYHLELALGAVRGVPGIERVVLKGYLGVDGFFVLSGFALWLGYHARPPRGGRGVADFLLRRFAKIWPLHALALLALAAVVGAASLAGFAINEPARFAAREFWLQLALVNTWETTDRLAWNYPSWALSAEWAGYLAFPLLLAGLLRLPGAAVLAAPALLLGGLLALGAANPRVDLNLTVHLGLARFAPEFALGLVLGRLCGEGRVRAGAALAVAATALPLGLALRVDALVVAGLAGLVAGVYLREAARPPGGAAPRDLVHRLGEASFGVYMCWVFIEIGLVAVLRAAEPGQPARLALMGAALGLNLLAGWLAHRWIEAPANRVILARLSGAVSGPAAAAAGRRR